MQIVDARGLSCPEPAMMAQAALVEYPNEPLKILVSSATSRDNVARIIKRKKRTFTIEPDGEDFALIVE